jgi:hypothetical protein
MNTRNIENRIERLELLNPTASDREWIVMPDYAGECNGTGRINRADGETEAVFRARVNSELNGMCPRIRHVLFVKAKNGYPASEAN